MNKRDEKALRKRLARVEARLAEVGVCPVCLQEYVHDGDEPFACCGCPGGTEWTGKPPLIWSLRRKQRND